MRFASAAFARAVALPHKLAVRVDVLYNREVIFEGVPVDDGSVQFDRTAAHLAQLSLTVADPVRVPVEPSSFLTPFGYELRVWRGLVIPGRDAYLRDEFGNVLTDEFGDPLTDENAHREPVTELLPLGTFPIQRSFVEGVTLGTSISAIDRSKAVSDARLEEDVQIAAGTNYADAIASLLDLALPGLEPNFPTVSETTPLLTFAAQTDVWPEVQRMARAFGHELYFDGLGVPSLRPEPTFQSEAAARVALAENLVSADLALDRANAYNRVVAFSSNASLGTQYRGVATDDDPNSPTNYFSGFGKKPRFYASEFIASQAQADSAAAAILASGLGVGKEINFAAVPDPRLECSDVVQVYYPRLELDSLHILDKMAISLGPEGAVTGNSRSQEGTIVVE